MSIFSSPSKRQIDLGLIVLRLVVGVIFVAHGGQKLFVFGFDGVAGAFSQMGIPMAGFLGPFVAFVEFFGGFALVAGLMTRLASFGLASTMVVAILVAHLKSGFFNPAGVEYPLLLLGSTLLLTITGAGTWSIDSMIGRRAKEGDAVPEVTKVRLAA